MAQNTHVITAAINYTRTDYTALRARLLKMPLARIAELYYSSDSPQVRHGLELFLDAMRDDVAHRALATDPELAKLLAVPLEGDAIPTSLDRLMSAAASAPAVPLPGQPISQWLRPKTAAVLHDEGIVLVTDLIGLVKLRGSGWWRSIPRIGIKRAGVITAWLRSNKDTLGELPDPTPPDQSPAPSFLLDPLHASRLAPLGHFTLSSTFDGSAGVNRNHKFCFIQAEDDLQAIESYLARFAGKLHTLRAYRKELERFLLWAIMVRRKPMSSLLVDDCNAYKDFLITPSPAFTGKKAARFTEQWRPFTPEPMTAKTQKQAVVILRAAFDYLVRVRYLGGNPWVAVVDPAVTEEVHAIQVEKALDDDLWDLLIDQLSQRASIAENAQDRAALAAILLCGDSGLRREEAAGSRRADLKPSQWAPTVSTLRVLGKRNKRRDVPVSERTLTALRAHWQDRGLDFDHPPVDSGNHPTVKDRALLAPLVIPRHAAAIMRHEEQIGNGYTSDGLYRLITSSIDRLQHTLLDLGIQPANIAQLATTTPHAFRHTFGTLAVASGMPQDVVQGVLGHVSAATTSIYVQAKEKRTAEEAAKYFQLQHENSNLRNR
ncbi:phage integrase family protein [Janthinobacterium lividum]|uniref:phage integrase family protein n=1 Tax=Janthinobacterium lividum TaxID=29581 RepID=UPI00159530AC|nr:phage integrase family protein [Janthinobacterium lividum]QKY11979.1 tyrosine-type recombinase/integrase [Janthinobacterium lividum]